MSFRRESLQPAPKTPVQPVFDLEGGLFSTSGQNTIHSLFAPLHYEQGYAYPLLVWLHGAGRPTSGSCCASCRW